MSRPVSLFLSKKLPFVRPAVLVVVMLVVFGMTFPVAGAPPTGIWRNGQVITFNQADWGGGHPCFPPCIQIDSTAASLLLANFQTVYQSSNLLLQIGLPQPTGFSVTFTLASAILAFLPQSDLPGALTGSLLNPTTTSSGSFGGDVVALTLNIDFTDAGLISGTLPLRFGDLRLCNLGQAGQVATLAQLNGFAVRQILPIANTLLGGGTVGGGILIEDIAPLITDLNGSFGGGLVTQFAQAHLCR